MRETSMDRDILRTYDFGRDTTEYSYPFLEKRPWIVTFYGPTTLAEIPPGIHTRSWCMPSSKVQLWKKRLPGHGRAPRLISGYAPSYTDQKRDGLVLYLYLPCASICYIVASPTRKKMSSAVWGRRPTGSVLIFSISWGFSPPS